jgi:lysophospholipase L1-like esterase
MRVASAVAGVLAVLAILAAPVATSAPVATWNVVALGDSDTTGDGDLTGLGWVGRYARLVHHRLGITVAVNNLAVEGKTSDELLSDVQRDPATRAAVKGAEVVLVGVGGADLNKGDDRLSAGRCKGTQCYAGDLRRFGTNLDRTAAAIRRLRPHDRAVLRAITLPNYVPGAKNAIPSFVTPAIGLFQTTTIARAVCTAMRRHDGRCADVLHALNGPTATENAYAKGWITKDPCCYPSGPGQQKMAEILLATGLAPLR